MSRPCGQRGQRRLYPPWAWVPQNRRGGGVIPSDPSEPPVPVDGDIVRHLGEVVTQDGEAVTHDA